jgi:hypothetical protein
MQAAVAAAAAANCNMKDLKRELARKLASRMQSARELVGGRHGAGLVQRWWMIEADECVSRLLMGGVVEFTGPRVDGCARPRRVAALVQREAVARMLMMKHGGTEIC